MDVFGRNKSATKTCVVYLLVVSSILCSLGDNNTYVTSKRNEEVYDSYIYIHAESQRELSMKNEDMIRSRGLATVMGDNVSGIDDNTHGEKISDMVKSHVNHSSFMEELKGQCNLFSGTWVHDASYPLYSATHCPYLGGQVNCRQNGRPDSDYEKWRWKPQGCNIPRFNAIDMLQRIRGKRLMFVGDSINRNQWESMVCLLQAVIPNNKKSVVYESTLTTFKALDYKASVEFFWAPFLVELDINNEKKRILRLDAIEKYGVYWKGVDILVFNSGHWWTHSGDGKSWDFVMEGNRVYENIDPMLAYRKGLTTWANWVTSNIDPRRTLVFFSGMSPKHYSSREWNEPNGHNCYDQREPVKYRSYKPPMPPQVAIVKEVLKRTRFPISLLDITRLSQFRKDGHPSVYSTDLTTEQRKDPDEFADCSHWCLPGVPDTWNELLYASVLIKG